MPAQAHYRFTFDSGRFGEIKITVPADSLDAAVTAAQAEVARTRVVDYDDLTSVAMQAATGGRWRPVVAPLPLEFAALTLTIVADPPRRPEVGQWFDASTGSLLAELVGENTKTIRVFGLADVLVVTLSHGDPWSLRSLHVFSVRPFDRTSNSTDSYPVVYRQTIAYAAELALEGWNDDLEDDE